MAVNAEYIDKHGRPSGRISSQAGLNAVVVDRGERMSREEGVKAPRAKSLPMGMSPGMIQGVPSAIMNQTKGEEPEQSVAGAAAQGFAGGFVAGAQNGMFGSSGSGEQERANPSWQKNNREVVALNTKIMAASARGLAMLERDIAATTGPADAFLHAQLVAARAKELEGFRAMQESMAHDQVNVDVQAGAHTDADVQALRQTLSRLQGTSEPMRANQPQSVGAASPGKSTGRAAPVRNAEGKSLADLTVPAPGEDPLPGTTQPLILDAVDAVQGIPPRRAAKGIARAVVMNPAHVAGLASLESHDADSLESAGSHYSR